MSAGGCGAHAGIGAVAVGQQRPDCLEGVEDLDQPRLVVVERALLLALAGCESTNARAPGGKELTMTLAAGNRRLRLKGGSASSHAKRLCLMNVRGEVTVGV